MKLGSLMGDFDALYAVFRIRIGEKVTPELAARWGDQTAMAIDWHEDVEPLYQTFLQYTGRDITDAFARLLAMQVSARRDELSRSPLVAFDRPTLAEWIAMEIKRVEEAEWVTKDGAKAGVELTMLVLSGRPAGHLLRRKFPATWLAGFAYQLGFSRKFQYDYDPRHFLGLRFWGFLQPQEDSQDLVFVDYAMGPKPKDETKKPTGELVKHNRQIIKLRTRFDHEAAECPFTRDHPCFDCEVKASQCIASPNRNA